MREPDNPFDPDAVKVVRGNGSVISYLRRILAAQVGSDLIDGSSKPRTSGIEAVPVEERATEGLRVQMRRKLGG